MAKLKLPIALDTITNELIHISNITKDNKDNYNFVCPECKTPLIIKMGDINVHHFAHKNADCEMNGESIIHLMAKDIISKNNEIVLPIYNPVTLRWQHIKHNYRFIESEKKYDDIIPDVVIEVDGRLIFIEVAYTHFINTEKHGKLKNIGIETWEINLKEFDLYDYKEFAHELLYSINYKEPFIIDMVNYRNYLNDDCISFKKQLTCEEECYSYIDYERLYNRLVQQYKNVKLQYFNFNKKFPLLDGDNIFRYYDIETEEEYWINLKVDKKYNRMKSFILFNNDEYPLAYYSIGKNGYYYQVSAGTYKEDNIKDIKTMKYKWRDIMNLLNKNRINLKYNKYNEGGMMFSAITY